MQIDLGTAPRQEVFLPPVRAIRVTTGAGKTRAAVQMIADGIKQNGRIKGRPWVYFVPTHRLGEDIVDQFAQHGVTAKVWRGRNNPVPGQPNRMMCDDLERVDLALKCGLSVNEACCKNESSRCPYLLTCAYQQQTMASPDVWIAAHENMFHSNKALGEPIGVIVDESFWQDGLRLSRPVSPFRRSDLTSSRHSARK
jgi:hypothetical protein